MNKPAVVADREVPFWIRIRHRTVAVILGCFSFIDPGLTLIKGNVESLAADTMIHHASSLRWCGARFSSSSPHQKIPSIRYDSHHLPEPFTIGEIAAESSFRPSCFGDFRKKMPTQPMGGHTCFEVVNHHQRRFFWVNIKHHSTTIFIIQFVINLHKKMANNKPTGLIL